MARGLIAPTVLAALAGALLTYGTFATLDAGGPAVREEATVETRGQHDDSRLGHRYDLALRTASGEHFQLSSSDAGFDLEPGLPVILEISEFGRSVQAVEAGGHRIPAGNSPVAIGLFVGFLTVVLLFMAVVSAVDAGRPLPVVVSVVAGFTGGALPVLLLF